MSAIQSSSSPNQSTSNLTLTVPAHPGQTQGVGSEAASSNPGSTVTSPTAAPQPRRSRGKALAEALSLRSSRNNSATDLSQREFSLPSEPLVDNQPLEVTLYRAYDDCPICFATYPGHLNYTRCCGNAICSECFVQIKRPDPHIPEGHGEQGSDPSSPSTNPAPAPAPALASPDQASRETHNLLVCEPAACPYCTQPELGVTYEPPPFRRGLVYANPAFLAGSAMSSQTSLHSPASPASPTSPPPETRRRGQSLSANAPSVVTTDRIRPDWALKLSALRTTQARRAAAATALHQAAFIMYNPERQFSLGARAPRFMRRNTSSSNGAARDETPRPDAAAPPGNDASAEDSRLQQFEEVMMAEAIRLSLAAEEDRRRKADREAEKEAKKEAKRREKEERKDAKAQKKAGSVYGDGAAARSRSSVSLALGRRRGNSSAAQAGSSPEIPEEQSGAPAEQQSDKGKAVDRGESKAGPSSMAIPQRSGHGPSHLRQTSNISSLSSSLADSPMGSYAARNDAGAGGASLGTNAGHESLFNFARMASTLGIDLERQDTGESARTGDGATEAREEVEGDSQGTTQVPEDAGDSAVTLQPGVGGGEAPDKAVGAPELRLIPGSPLVGDGEFTKGFEHESSAGQRGGEVA
ncbi:MAG: hypothetical protein IMZ46_10005 [Acidobacteria bacterium]|nr:hypothetical protein [Acidobacteriota bacterium]